MSFSRAPTPASTGENAVPQRMRSMGARTLVQFFVGGFVLFVAASMLSMAADTSEYDGIVSFISGGIVGILVAVPSMVAAMIIGLPLRLVPALRSQWLSHGEITIVGAVLSFAACVVIIVGTPAESVIQTRGWILLAAWAVFAMSIAHFVWPLRWITRQVQQSSL